MAINISPGVYTKIIDLSTYVQVVPSTIGFICALTKKGRDNQLLLIASRSDLISEWGEPNIQDYGKHYGQGPYCAYNFLGEAGSLYFMRCLPEDAAFANMRIDAKMAAADATASIVITYVSDMETLTDLNTNLADDDPKYPIAFLYPIGRGEYYNAIGVRFTEHSNPLLSDVYTMDIYEKQSDGDDVIIESFEVSFNPKAVDDVGESIFIVDVLNMYSSVLRADMTLTSGAYTGGYELIAKVYDKDIGTVSTVKTVGSATITDNKQDFSDWQTTEAGGVTLEYVVIATDGKGNKIWGWLGDASGDDNETINVFDERHYSSATQSWKGDTSLFNVPAGEITYIIKKANTSIASAFTSSEPVPLKRGSDGELLDDSGDLDTTIAKQILAQGYAGVLDDQVLDDENIYFTLVYDCGYPDEVKTSISSLVQTRRDCVGILDNGDNSVCGGPSSTSGAVYERLNNHTYNTYLLALYEEYNKVYDIFTGKDVWFSPTYHMSYILPRNDNVSELWYAAAGFNRAAIDSIKELRFNPNLDQRDTMYLKQLNPIVKFNPGYVVWGQLTTQAKASALQDLNIVRLVLYCKRALSEYCRYFIFEQNDAITWNMVSGDIVEFLEVIKKRRGLYDYNVEVSATNYEKKRKIFHVDVILNPTRVVEKIELNFFIK